MSENLEEKIGDESSGLSTKQFLINGAISSVPFVVGGYVGAEITDLISDSPQIISWTSTASQYVAGYTTFMGLNAYQNSEKYRSNDGWDLGILVKDTAKTVFSLGIAEVAYIAGRPQVMDYFIGRSVGEGQASLYADLICIPLFFGIAVPLAKKMGLIEE